MPDREAASGEGQAARRPYVLLSAAMSVDGYIDDASAGPAGAVRRGRS